MGKLISVHCVWSNNIWVVSGQLFSVEGILSCNVEGVEGALFSSGCVTKWCIRSRSILKHFNKFITYCNIISFRTEVV